MDVNHERTFPPGLGPKVASAAELVHSFGPEEPIVSMLVHKDRVFVCTSRTLYALIDGELRPVPIVREDAK